MRGARVCALKYYYYATKDADAVFAAVRKKGRECWATMMMSRQPQKSTIIIKQNGATPTKTQTIIMTPPLSSSLTSAEAIRKNNARTERKFIARQQKRSKQARADAPRVAALRRAFAVRAKTQARAVLAAALAATEAVRAATEAARALQALDAELREAMRVEIGAD